MSHKDEIAQQAVSGILAHLDQNIKKVIRMRAEDAYEAGRRDAMVADKGYVDTGRTVQDYH